jgi:mono/diheme cytochrome c family protein
MPVMLSRRAVTAAAAAAALTALAVPARAADPATVFGRSCSPCHGKEGEPSPVFAKQGVRNFKDPAWQKATSDAHIEQTIKEGKKGTMMASFEKQLSAEEIKGLVGYIRKLGGAKK